MYPRGLSSSTILKAVSVAGNLTRHRRGRASRYLQQCSQSRRFASDSKLTSDRASDRYIQGVVDTEPPSRHEEPNLSLNLFDPEPNLKYETKVEPIPELPQPVKGWPTPWMSRTHMAKYLQPLYTRGWGVMFKKPNGQGKYPDTAMLVNQYRFANIDGALNFTTEVGDIMTGERHHFSQWDISNGNPTTINMLIYTHTAIRPRWPQETDKSLSRDIPGITLRDLRLAILIERLYAIAYVPSGRGVDPEPKAMRRPKECPTWEFLTGKLVKACLGPREMRSEGRRERTGPERESKSNWADREEKQASTLPPILRLHPTNHGLQ